MIDLLAQKVLIARHQILIPQGAGQRLGQAELVTIMSNIAHYGYALSQRAYAQLLQAPAALINAWWEDVELILASLTGADRKMGDFVVYKNFPAEVLEMSQAQYWFNQILMYWGLPNELFTQDVTPRPAMLEQPAPRVLHPVHEDALGAALLELLRSSTRWNGDQWEEVRYLALKLGELVPLSQIPFKENMVKLAMFLLEHRRDAQVSTATDALRLAVVMSGGEASLRRAVKLRAFTRAERRFLLTAMEHATNLLEDLSRRPELFKRLIHALHPGDYKARYPKVIAAADALYRGQLERTYNSRLEEAIKLGEAQRALALLRQRPGEFARRLHAMILRFGMPATQAFIEVLGGLPTARLVTLLRYLETINAREYRLFPPRGNWGKVRLFKDGELITAPKGAKPLTQRPFTKLKGAKVKAATGTIRKHNSRRLGADDLGLLTRAISQELAARLKDQLPSVALDPRAAWIKLPDNDSELLPYGRGTRWPIPKEVTFIRTASYWSCGDSPYNVWFDVGWNFFDERWRPLGTCCWDSTGFRGAAFSGDPTSSKELKGRACQMIDLYLDQLAERKVRYAVWSVLCFSRLSFNQADEVFAAMMFGEDATRGELFEPSRAQITVPIKGDNLAKFVTIVDVQERQVIYLDANLSADVSTATRNAKRLSRAMPALMEYLDSRPSVYDLFKSLPRDAQHGVPILYDDLASAPKDEQLAYVFRPQNERSAYEPLALNELLAYKPPREAKKDQ